MLGLAGLMVFAWRRRNVSAARPFVVACGLSMLWVGGGIGEYLSLDVATRAFWFKFQIAMQLPTLTAICSFVLEFAWPGRWLTRRNLLLLYTVPALVALIIMTNDYHHLMWTSLTAGDSILPIRGPANWPFIMYAMVLGLIEVTVLAQLFIRSPAHRAPAALILLTLAANRAAYLLMATDHPLALILHSETSLVGIAALSFAVALFGFRILNPVTQAMRTVMAQMRDGLIVLEPNGNVASINPAAGRILGVSTKGAVGTPLTKMLGPISIPLSAPGDELPGSLDIAIGRGAEARQVVVSASDLKDWRGVVSGRLLLLRDVTGERQAQEQILEQQRALATMTERERLARELHDSLGQTLAAAHMQVKAVRLLLERGQPAAADEYLGQLAEMTHAAEVDIREYILGARRSLAGDQPFFAVLRDYAARYGQRFGLAVDLCAPVELEQAGFDPLVETQLYRVIQEALSNVRKHAQAQRVQLEFALEGPMLRVGITDDGRGFDQAEVAARIGEGYGQQTMRERAESLGGSLEIRSAPGQGTSVTVTVPLGEGRTGDV